MNDWLIARRKDDNNEKNPYRMQVNKLNITYIEMFEDRMYIHLTSSQLITLYFKEWEVSF